MTTPPPESGTVQLVQGQVVQPWASGTFTGQDPDQDKTILVCKLGWWASAPWDVRAYAAGHPAYPTDSTLEQLYDSAEFDAYRELGAARGQAGAAGEPPIPNLSIQKVGIGRMSFSDQESRPQIHDSVPKARCIAASAALAAPLLQPRAAAGEARVPGSCPVVVLGTADWRERVRCASACGLADIVHADVVVATRAQRFRRDQARLGTADAGGTPGAGRRCRADGDPADYRRRRGQLRRHRLPGRPLPGPPVHRRHHRRRAGPDGPRTARSSGSARSGTTGPASSARSPTQGTPRRKNSATGNVVQLPELTRRLGTRT